MVDSRVICEYLIKQSRRFELLPEMNREYLLSRAALADGDYRSCAADRL